MDLSAAAVKTTLRKIKMIRLLCLFILAHMAVNCFGQTVTLRNKKTASDVSVINHNYTMFFKKTDLIAAISKIDSVLKTNNSLVVQGIKDDKIQSIDLQNSPETNSFAGVFKNNLGSYLLSKGLASLEKEGKPIIFIVAEKSPEMVGLDGSSTITISFSEKGSENPVFIGDMNVKLKVLK